MKAKIVQLVNKLVEEQEEENGQLHSRPASSISGEVSSFIISPPAQQRIMLRELQQQQWYDSSNGPSHYRDTETFLQEL